MSLKKIKKITAELDEAKQVGTLYHFTTYKSLANILHFDRIYSNKSSYGDESEYVSFTRDKNIYRKTNKDNVFNEILMQGALVLDGDALSRDYKINPYSHFGLEPLAHDKYYRKEAEERIKAEYIPVKKYLIKILTLGKEDFDKYYNTVNDYKNWELLGSIKYYQGVNDYKEKRLEFEDYLEYLRSFGVLVEIIRK